MSAARNIAVAREYLQAVERFATGDDLAKYFTPDVVQQEFPNRLVPQGAQRGLAEMLAGSERGKELLKQQTLAVKNTVADGNFVAVEFEWTGVLAQPIGHLAAGDSMRAHIAAFLEFTADGRIKNQRNYDCYQPL
jgi:ketosteroid isomerase-like protein